LMGDQVKVPSAHPDGPAVLSNLSDNGPPREPEADFVRHANGTWGHPIWSPLRWPGRHVILHNCLHPAVARLAVRLVHIDQQDPPVRRVADDLDLPRVLAAAVPAALVLLLRELPHRLAAQLLERPADLPHVEEELRLRGDLRRRADAH